MAGMGVNGLKKGHLPAALSDLDSPLEYFHPIIIMSKFHQYMLYFIYT